jgi:hypothetical protein
MKLTLSRFFSKDITTSRGVATVLNFQAAGKWYSSGSNEEDQISH